MVRNDRTYQITRLESLDALLSHEEASWKAVAIYQRPPIATSSLRGDLQCTNTPSLNPSNVTNAESIIGVRLLNAKSVAIPTRPSTAPGLNVQAQFPQRLYQRKACGIDSRRIPKRRFGLRFHLWIAKFARRSIAFPGIALIAREHQIGEPMRSTTAAWQQMIHFKGDIERSTVHTAMLELLQEIGADFPSAERAMLIGGPTDLWLLHQLQVKLHALHLDA
jgi:hypothetical protein